jgi:hypothetical protein
MLFSPRHRKKGESWRKETYGDDFTTDTVGGDQTDGDFVGLGGGSETTTKKRSHFLCYVFTGICVVCMKSGVESMWMLIAKQRRE